MQASISTELDSMSASYSVGVANNTVAYAFHRQIRLEFRHKLSQDGAARKHADDGSLPFKRYLSSGPRAKKAM